MPKMKLTQAAVDRLKAPEIGRVEYWDTTLPAFGLRLTATGARSWVCMYRVDGKLVRETLGTLAAIPDLGKARAMARASMQRAQAGINPADERRQREDKERQQAEAKAAEVRDTLAAAIDRYLQRYAVKRMRSDYFVETKRTLDRDVKAALGARAIGEITRRDIRELLDAVVDRGSPSHANHVLAYFRAFANWAIGQDLIATNPCNGLKMPAPLVQRDRALDDEEIRLFWLACDRIGWPFGPLFKLLLLTGQRRDELSQATWSEFDLDNATWTLPGARTKNGKTHVVQLAPAAIEILSALPRTSSPYLFTTNGTRPVSGWGRARERLAVAIAELNDGTGIELFTLHDLRRSAATGMAALGVAHHVVDKILNHVAGRISGVAAIYNRHEYAEERRHALDAWARHVVGLMSDRPDNVTLLRRG